MNHQNGSKKPQNGRKPQNGKSLADKPPVMTLPPKLTLPLLKSYQPRFDKSVVLEQPGYWSRAILWAILGCVTTGLVWAFNAKIDQSVQATGALEPHGSVKEVQVPVPGVIKTVNVEDGQTVKQGDLLFSLEATSAAAQVKSLQQVRTAVIQENNFYQALIQSSTPMNLSEQTIAQLKLKPELADLARSRNTLVAENLYYRTLLRDNGSGSLNSDQRERLQSSQEELNSRRSAAQAQVAQLEKQLSANQAQLSRSRDVLKVNQGILKDLESLVTEGGNFPIAISESVADRPHESRGGGAAHPRARSHPGGHRSGARSATKHPRCLQKRLPHPNC
ncbi:HlyD family secretion protein [Neosynechococcus sphagnicola]|uniref:HlyD family secretion protein n=1 Tax=Neosynechococcus sphagnicola TaxID=1501145 RepID=UPI000690A903|nr:biotin/lipoyl-binding protein [Neosynechococcus sphagnicola]